MLYSICIALILIASVLVILAVLVQNPNSGMAANFGVSNQVMGVRETSNFLEKFTWTMAVAIVVLSLVATLAMDPRTGGYQQQRDFEGCEGASGARDRYGDARGHAAGRNTGGTAGRGACGIGSAAGSLRRTLR